MIIRKASEEDITQLMDIYNEAVLHTTATFDMEEKSLKNRQNWFYEHQSIHSLIVAVEGCRVLGYASLSPYRSRAAYDTTVEVSVYIREENRGEGLGKTLMERILDIAKDEPTIHNVVSLITAENEVSCHLHERTGFRLCGTIQDAGRKFGRYLSVNIYQILV